jgi:hypothetical protein
MDRVASGKPRVRACSHQRQIWSEHGQELVACTLAFGACAVQRKYAELAGSQECVCALPHCVFTDWQVVELGDLPAKQMRPTMSADPVPVPAPAARRINGLTNDLGSLKAQVHDRVCGRVRDLELFAQPNGVVVRGIANSYYVKQLALNALLEASSLPILANEIRVRAQNRRANQIALAEGEGD